MPINHLKDCEIKSLGSEKCTCDSMQHWEDAVIKNLVIEKDNFKAINADLLEALKYVRKFYQENFENMPVNFQTVDNELEQAIARVEGK